MNTHPNEDTLYDNNVKNTNEETVIDNNVVSNNVNNNEPKSRSRFGRVASGLGMGILLGGTSSFVTAKTVRAAEKDDTNEEETNNGEETNNETDNNNETNNGTDVIDTPNNEGTDEWSDGALPVAESVNDSMTFSEAFGAARAEVGPGGVFEWRGNVYNTYYAEEWNNMSEEDKSEFVNHLSLTEIEDEPEPSGDVVEVVVADEVNTNETIEVTPVNDEVNQEPEVEVYGVYHDDEYNMNVGVASIDDQEVLFIDADGDGENFEYMACDLDGNGQVDESEIVDISEYEMPVDSLMIDNSQMAYDDTLDYTSDADGYDMM